MNWLIRHPLMGYVALAFGISWIGILIILAARGFDLSPILLLEAGMILLFMQLGPSLSGLIVTGCGRSSGISRAWRASDQVMQR